MKQLSFQHPCDPSFLGLQITYDKKRRSAMFCMLCIQLALLGIYSPRDSTFFEKVHLRIIFIWRSQTKPQWNWTINKCATESWWLNKNKGWLLQCEQWEGRQRAASGPPKKSRQLFQKDRRKRQLSKHWWETHTLNLPSFVHNLGFCFLQVWCPIASESSRHYVLLLFGIHNNLSHKVLKKCVTLRGMTVLFRRA